MTAPGFQCLTSAALMPQAIGMLQFNKQIKKIFSLSRSIFTTLAAMILQTWSCLSVLLGASYWLNEKILTYVWVSYEGSYSQRKEMSTNRGAFLEWESHSHTLSFSGVQENPFEVYVKLRCVMYWAVAYSPRDKVSVSGPLHGVWQCSVVPAHSRTGLCERILKGTMSSWFGTSFGSGVGLFAFLSIHFLLHPVSRKGLEHGKQPCPGSCIPS